MMRVGIAGAGAIAMGYAAFLLDAGHEPFLWSPSGEGTKALKAGEALKVTGKLEGEFRPAVSDTAAQLAQNDVIIIALPAYGHRAVLDALIPHLEPRHTVIISGHLSFAALYVSKKLKERGIEIPVVAWNTTALTAKAPVSRNEVRIGLIRSKIFMVTIPASRADVATEICVGLFGDRFAAQDDLISIALTNLNPQNHLGIALCNLTRMERGEEWGQNTNITPAVAKLLEALDAERVALATAWDKNVPTLQENMSNAMSAPGLGVAEIYALQAERGNNPLGPKTLDTRYITEDVPFGLATTLMLAKLAGVQMPLHQAGNDIISACYARNFTADNDLLPELGTLDLHSLRSLAKDGYAA